MLKLKWARALFNVLFAVLKPRELKAIPKIHSRSRDDRAVCSRVLEKHSTISYGAVGIVVVLQVLTTQKLVRKNDPANYVEAQLLYMRYNRISTECMQAQVANSSVMGAVRRNPLHHDLVGSPQCLCVKGFEDLYAKSMYHHLSMVPICLKRVITRFLQWLSQTRLTKLW